MIHLKDAGFQRAERVPTGGQPGVFARSTRHPGRGSLPYDVNRWTAGSSPRGTWRSWTSRDRQVVVGRSAVNQRGRNHFLAACAYRAPTAAAVNLVFVAGAGRERLAALTRSSPARYQASVVEIHRRLCVCRRAWTAT
jgi:hypothetical protein